MPPMNEKDVLSVFKRESAFLSGHFLLSSGLHSPNYMQCALVLQKPNVAEKLCRELAKKLKGLKVDAVIGPALGGMIVSYEMGRALKVRSLFAERVDGAFVLRRGFSLKRGERVLVVEDVITTGKSIYEVIDLVKQHDAKIAAVASIVDRSDGAAIFAEDFHALLRMTIKTYRPEDCPLCRERRIPLTKPGSRGLKALALVFAVFCLFGPPVWAAQSVDTTSVNYDQARRDYRRYLQELKKLSSEYKQFTGELSQIMKEEGFPTLDGVTDATQTTATPADPQTIEGEGYRIREETGRLNVEIDLPGLRRDSLKVVLREHRWLVVTGRRKADDRSVERTIELPVPAGDKDLRARYEDGVLTVTLPKIEGSVGEVPIPIR